MNPGMFPNKHHVQPFSKLYGFSKFDYVVVVDLDNSPRQICWRYLWSCCYFFLCWKSGGKVGGIVW